MNEVESVGILNGTQFVLEYNFYVYSSVHDITFMLPLYLPIGN
jgi:hypothetical protein